MNKGGFSWKRLTGVARIKQKISRATGVPLTKSGRQRKIGGMIYKGKGCLITILLVLGFILLFFIIPEIAKANPFCLMPETSRGPVEEFGCKTHEDFVRCNLLSEAGYMELGIYLSGSESSIKEMQAGMQKLPKEFQNVDTADKYVNAVSGCIQKSTSEIDPLFTKAKSQLKKSGNNGALEALKDLYSYWMASMTMDIIAPHPGKPELLYKSQFNERELGISERVNRLKTEL